MQGLLCLCLALTWMSRPCQSVYFSGRSRNLTSMMQNSRVDLSDNEIVMAFDVAVGVSQRHRFKTRQLFRGIPIFGASLVTEEGSSGELCALTGKWLDKQKIAQSLSSTSPSLSQRQVLDIVYEALSISEQDLHGAVTPELTIYLVGETPHLSYLVNHVEYGRQLPMTAMFIVDAHTGDVLRMTNNQLSVMEACGTGGTAKTGDLEYCVDSSIPPLLVTPAQGALLLQNDRIRVLDSNHGTPGASDADDVAISCVASTESQCDIQDAAVNGGACAACDVFSYADGTFSMYSEWMGVDYPVAEQMIPLAIHVHVGTDYLNAYFSSSRGLMAFGDGVPGLAYPLTTAAVTAHEIAHGFTDKGSDLVYGEESGGMNEAYSDIAAECFKFWLRGENDWATGSEVFVAEDRALRYMYDPPLDGASIGHYDDYHSDMDVHHSSGLYNKAAYLLSTRYGWSMEQLFKVFSTANLYYWQQDSSFHDGVCGLIAAVDQLYPSQSSALELDIDGAFAQVGVSCDASLQDSGTLCASDADAGVDTYCFFEEVRPSDGSASALAVAIKSDHASGTRQFAVQFHVRDRVCVQPSVSFEFEQIGHSFEWDDASASCAGAANRDCGSFATCRDKAELGVALIGVDDTYTVTVSSHLAQGSSNAFCSDGADELSVNAVLTLHCEAAPPTEIECGAPQTGSIASGEALDFRFDNAAQQSVSFSTCLSSIDTKLFLLDAQGTRIESQSSNGCDGDDCHDTDVFPAGTCHTLTETFTMRALEVGAYSLHLQPYSAGGEYDLRVVCELDALGSSESTTAAPVLQCGDTVTGHTRFEGDGSARPFVLDAPVSKVTVSTCNSSFDTTLGVLDQNETAIAYCDDCGSCADSGYHEQLVLHDLQAGLYHALVKGYGSGFGEYALQIDCDNTPADASSATATNTTSTQVCHAQGPCDSGFVDVTDGAYFYWACGRDCAGGSFWTDDACSCSCEAAPTTGNCAALSSYDNFNLYRYAPYIRFFRYFGWCADYVAGAAAVALLVSAWWLSLKLYAKYLAKREPYASLKLYDSEANAVEHGDEAELEKL